MSDLPEVERLRREINEFLQLRDRAVGIAHGNIEKRLDAMNEFRQALNDQSRTFVQRPELDLRLGVVGDRLATLERNQNKFFGAAIIVSVLVPVILRFLFK